MKTRRIYPDDFKAEAYPTREKAKSSIFEYIEAYYNSKRRHRAINYMTPNQFEDMMQI